MSRLHAPAWAEPTMQANRHMNELVDNEPFVTLLPLLMVLDARHGSSDRQVIVTRASGFGSSCYCQ